MENAILEEIKDFALKKLKQEYGFVGVAEGEDMAMLNSSDGKGNDIKIVIESNPE